MHVAHCAGQQSQAFLRRSLREHRSLTCGSHPMLVLLGLSSGIQRPVELADFDKQHASKALQDWLGLCAQLWESFECGSSMRKVLQHQAVFIVTRLVELGWIDDTY